MSDADKKLKELTSELGRIDAKCDHLQKWNPDHYTTTHFQCVRRREGVESLIFHWRTQAGGVTA